MQKKSGPLRMAAALLALCLLLSLGTAVAEGPRAVERVRFAGAGVSLELPLHWMYMDLTDSFQAEADEPILMDGEPVTITCYVLFADAAQTMTINLIALQNEDRLDAQAEFDTIIAYYGDLAEVRMVDGRDVCIYPDEDGGMAAVTYTDDNLITLYANISTGTGGQVGQADALLSNFLALVSSLRFFPVTP